MIDGRNFVDQPVKKDIITYKKVATGLGDDITTGSLLDTFIPKKVIS